MWGWWVLVVRLVLVWVVVLFVLQALGLAGWR